MCGSKDGVGWKSLGRLGLMGSERARDHHKAPSCLHHGGSLACTRQHHLLRSAGCMQYGSELRHGMSCTPQPAVPWAPGSALAQKQAAHPAAKTWQDSLPAGSIQHKKAASMRLNSRSSLGDLVAVSESRVSRRQGKPLWYPNRHQRMEARMCGTGHACRAASCDHEASAACLQAQAGTQRTEPS